MSEGSISSNPAHRVHGNFCAQVRLRPQSSLNFYSKRKILLTTGELFALRLLDGTRGVLLKQLNVF